MHTRNSEATQGRGAKPCGHPPAEQLSPYLGAGGARGVLPAALPTGDTVDPPRKRSCVHRLPGSAHPDATAVPGHQPGPATPPRQDSLL